MRPFLATLVLGLFISIQVCFGTDYILDLRARGAFGDSLNTYWKAVLNNPKISHPAITDFPPHCSLTGFFPPKKSKAAYIKAVQKALSQYKTMPPTVTVGNLVQGANTSGSHFDYIALSSAYALAVTKAFMHNAGVPAQYLKDPSKQTYHITLRNIKFKTTAQMKTIQSLENKIHLNAHASWSLFLYERKAPGSKLKVIKEFPI